ncbi:acyl carrier protein [Clostridia bacterium]|nr:acyl carrier protein [Clostridia bacterium]
MADNAVFTKVSEVLAAHLSMDISEITLDATFEQLGLDSLDTVEIVMELEDFFNVTIETNENVTKVSDFVDIIEKQKK